MYGETDSLRDDVGIRDSISSNISAPLFGETNPQVRDISYFSGKPTLRFGIFLSFRGKTLRFGIFLTFWGKNPQVRDICFFCGWEVRFYFV